MSSMSMRAVLVAAGLWLAAAPGGGAWAGEWLVDERNGCKIWNAYPEPGEAATWDGPCVDGYSEGSGIVNWFKDGAANGRYEGERKGGKANGYGVNVWASGDRYEGFWKDDTYNGWGTYAWANGSAYQGDWVDGKKHGNAVYVWPHGDRFEGSYRDNQPFGGIYVRADGARFIAEIYGHTIGPGQRFFTPEERTYVRTVGSRVCRPGSTFFGMIDTGIEGFVEGANTDRIQIRIARTGLLFQTYQNIALGQNTIIWDDADNWEPCAPAAAH